MSSSLCIIDLFADDMGYAERNNLARRVVSYALDNNIGAQFNPPDYSETLIKSHGRQFFVALSDSFLYTDALFLEDYFFLNPADLSASEKDFFKHFYFLREILDIIFASGVKRADVYMSEDSDDDVNDFRVLKTTPSKFLHTVFDCIVASADRFAYTFPSMRLVVLPEANKHIVK